MKHQVLISGAGIGGLTTALAFLARGWQVRVFEQASQLEEVGAGVQLGPNGMKVLEALGVADAVRDRAFRPEALEMRTGRSGHRIFRVPLKDKTLDRWGGDYLHIHRADLQAVLVEALADRSPDALALDARAAGYRQGETGATLKLIDGRLFEADLVVGADGLKSALRSQMHGPEAARFTGNVAWRAVVPIEALGDLAPPPTACVWTGPKRHAVTYRLRGGSLCNLVGIVERDDTGAESWNRMGKADAFAADFAEFHPIIRRMVELAGDTPLWALHDRAPLPHWHEGRVVLLGDAAHPTLPFLASGAVMAIEDGWLLAALCGALANDIEGGLAAFYRKRIERTARVQAGSRANAGRFHRSGLLSQLGTYGPMWLGGRLAPGVVRGRLDWLYGYDVTTEAI